MSTKLQIKTKFQSSPKPSSTALWTGSIQRDCERGESANSTGKFADSRVKHLVSQSYLIQPKLIMGQPEDKYEQEADRVADMVVGTLNHHNLQKVPNTSEPLLQKQSAIHPVANSTGNTEIMKVIVNSGRGRPLDNSTRKFMESRFAGTDFGHVRLHFDHGAAKLARRMKARALTFGRDVVFGANQYAPQSVGGRELLAHELAHVLQADANRSLSTISYPNVMASALGKTCFTDSVNSPAERQANRMARAVVMGLPICEAINPASGIHLTPADQPTVTVPSPVQTEPPLYNPNAKFSILELLAIWRRAGLLDLPFRPLNVQEIPPVSISKDRLQTLGFASATGVAAPEMSPTVRPSARPSLRVIPGEGLGPKPLIPALSLGSLIALVVIIVAWPRGEMTAELKWQSQKKLESSRSRITGNRFSIMEELFWESALSAPQCEYLQWLFEAGKLIPQSTVEDEPEYGELPAPLPQPKEEEAETICFSKNIPHLGGNARHNAYATKVSTSPFDYFVKSRRGSAIAYDGRTPNALYVWEVKVGHGWFFNPDYASLRDLRLAAWDAQKNLGLRVARDCGYSHIWSITDRCVAGLLIARWGGNPPVYSIPE